MTDNKFEHRGTEQLGELISSLNGNEDNRLEKKNDFLFVEHWKEGETPFNWRKQWEKLSLEILSTDGPSDKTTNPVDDAHSASEIILPLHANCSTLKNKISIRLIENGISYLSSRIFDELDVTINAIDENHRMGNIFHIDNNLAQYSNMLEAMCISCTVPVSWLDEIRHYTRAQAHASAAELDFNIHCFSKEYDRFSAELGVHKKYSIEKGGTGYAFLADYRVIQNNRDIG